MKKSILQGTICCVLSIIFYTCAPIQPITQLIDNDFETENYICKYQLLAKQVGEMDPRNTYYERLSKAKRGSYIFDRRTYRMMIVTDKKYVWEVPRYFATLTLLPRLNELAFCKKRDSILRLSMQLPAPPMGNQPLKFRYSYDGHTIYWDNYQETEYQYQYSQAFKDYSRELEKNWKGVVPQDSFSILVPSKYRYQSSPYTSVAPPMEAIGINLPSYMERRGNKVYQNHYVSYNKDSVQVYFSLNKKDTTIIQNFLELYYYVRAKSVYQGIVKIKQLNKVYTCHKVKILLDNEEHTGVRETIIKYYDTENFIPICEEWEHSGIRVTDILKSMESVLDCKCYK